MRRLQPRLRERDLALLDGLSRDIGDRRGDLRLQVLDRGQVDVQFAADTLLREHGDPAQPARRTAEELRNAVRPTQIQMCVVLPGDADATEHLDAVLGVGLGEFDARGRRDGSGDRQLRIVGVMGGVGRVTCGHRDLLGAQQHLRAHVLDRLEAADRLAELLANLRVVGGGLQCPPRQPGGLGGLHRRGEVLDASPRDGKYLGGGVGEHDPGQWTGEVGRRQRLHCDAIGGGVDEKEVVAGGQQQHPVGVGSQHVFGGARYPAAVVVQLGAQREARRTLAGGQRLKHLGLRTRHHQRGNRGGGDRTGHQSGSGLIDHRAEVVDGAAGSARFLRQGHPEDAQLGQARVGRAPGVGIALLDTAGRLDGTRPRCPATDQFTRGKLLVGDGR